jgi:hypothetical protein
MFIWLNPTDLLNASPGGGWEILIDEEGVIGF